MSKIIAFLARISPSGNPLKVQIVLLIMGLLFGLSFCHYAKGAELDIMLGSAVVRGPTGVAAMDVVFPKVIGGFGNLEAGFDLIGESNFSCTGNNPECNANQSVVHAEAVAPIPYVGELGIGIAHIQHPDAYNSGSINFSLSLEHHVWHNLYVRYQHFSNAGTSAPNEGRDIVLAVWRFGE